MCPNGALGLIIVCLRPEAASRIVGMSLGDFANGNIHLASIFRSCEVSICDDMLAQAHTSSERIATVESFLLRHVRPYRDDIACRAVSYLRRNPTLSVSELATKLSVSSRHLARSFNSTLGVGPKQFARLARFENMVTQHRSGLSWAQVAAACGLTDQPHLIKEFRSLTGELPTEFFARELPMMMPGEANFVVQSTSH
jgi:AraC-like DNA-binding protein